MANGSIENIWLKRAHGGVMDPHDSVVLVEGKGIEGSIDYGSPRHVTLIDWERWQVAQKNLGAEVDPSARRANVLVSGIPLAETRGRTLKIGDARIEIRGETRPCETMDKAHQGLRTELQRDWGGGAWGVVVAAGTIRIGDPVEWVPDTAETVD